MTRLYDLTESYRGIAALLDDETMDPEVISTALAEINGSITEKCANIAGLIKDYDADADAIRAEEKRLADRRRAIENRREWLKGYIKENMERMELGKIKTPLVTFRLQNNPPAVVIDNMGDLPKGYIVETISQVADKKAIAAAIKAGEIVPGARLSQGVSLRIK